uniref:GDSL esterase/lipase n=1 Tax=Aegilops tauschii subsp. strangulata TaxID=200361 RepID=A0A453GDW7_AEGTS
MSSYKSSPAMQRRLVLVALPLLLSCGVRGQVVPAVISFGDSTIDVGNNNYLPGAVFKANYAPYGENFRRHRATGRFSDGKIVTDITAETLGFEGYAPPYLSPLASGKNLLTGANFGSAASSYSDDTAAMYVRCNHAVAAAQVLQGVQVQAGGGGRAAAGAHHPRRGAVRRQHRHRRLHPELLPQRLPVRPLRRRPLLRPPRRHLLRLRQRAVQAGGAADRRDDDAAAGVPAGDDQAVRQGPERRRVPAEAQPRRGDLQPEAERHRGGAAEAARGPQGGRLRRLHAAPGPLGEARGAGLRGGEEDVLPDGEGRDEGLPLRPGDGGRDVPERQQLRVLRRRAPVGGGQPGRRRVPGVGGHRLAHL